MFMGWTDLRCDDDAADADVCRPGQVRSQMRLH